MTKKKGNTSKTVGAALLRIRRGEPAPDPIDLESEWHLGPVMRWRFQRPTRVFQFEVRAAQLGGEFVTSILVGASEQLTGPLPLEMCGKRLHPFVLETLAVGMLLLVRVTSAKVEMRPVGIQVGP